MNKHHPLSLLMLCHAQGTGNGKSDQEKMIKGFFTIKIQCSLAAGSLRVESRSVITHPPLPKTESNQAEKFLSLLAQKTHNLVPYSLARVKFRISHVQCEICNYIPCTFFRDRILRKCSKKFSTLRKKENLN